MFPNVQCPQPANLAKTIDAAFERRDEIGPKTEGDVREAVEQALDLLDRGTVRVADGPRRTWKVNQWLKKAVLLSFRLSDMSVIGGGPATRCGGTKYCRNSIVGTKALSRRRLSRGAGLRRPPLGLSSRRAWC